MKTVKFCRDCVWSKPEERSEWNIRCHHPNVVSKDEYALADSKNNGTSAHTERKLSWNLFSTPACGQEGKLYEPRS